MIKRSYTIPIFILLILFAGESIAQPGSRHLKSLPATDRFDTVVEERKIFILNNSRDTIEIADRKNGKIHGIQRTFYNGGNLRTVAEYKNGLLDGKKEHYTPGVGHPIRTEHFKAYPKEDSSRLNGDRTEYDREGKITEHYRYKHGVKQGRYRLYHSDGTLREEGTYEAGLHTGNKRTYQSNGTLLSDEHFIIIRNPDTGKKNRSEKLPRPVPEKISVLQGKVKYYFRSGLLYQDLEFEQGKKNGVCKEYFDDLNNSLRSEVVFKDGLEHGAFAYYRPDGNLDRKGIHYAVIKVGDSLLRNVYEGTLVHYQENGERSRVENWRNFKPNGTWESYHYRTGVISSRSNYVDGWKSGIEEQFDANGVRSNEAFYEIVTVDGKTSAQKTGTESSWENGQLKQTTEWRNGKVHGLISTFYPDGALESLKTYVDGALLGAYKTYYPNGQIKEDLNYAPYALNRTNERVGWNTIYNEQGQATHRFYAKGDSKNLIEQKFVNGSQTELIIPDLLRITCSEQGKLTGINWSYWHLPYIGYDVFRTGELRRVSLKQHHKDGFIKAHFLQNGQVNQLQNLSGDIVPDKEVVATAQKIAEQFNPEWKNVAVISNTSDNGNAGYQWHYKDGTPFFNIRFKDGLPHGNWVVFNPINKDTLLFAQFDKGLKAGTWVRKTMDGLTDHRQTYYPDHKEKESYEYGSKGQLTKYIKKDTAGSQAYVLEYYDNGRLKEERDAGRSSYLRLSEKGDTTGYDLLFTERDSIRIQKEFYPNKRLRSLRYNNISTGLGYAEYYFDNGQLQTTTQLKSFVNDGEYKRFDDSGRTLHHGHHKAGKREGTWTRYTYEDGKVLKEVSQFKAGELIIIPSEEDDAACKCYDRSLPHATIGFAPSLEDLATYRAIKPYIPKSIIPIGDWEYDKIFYVGLITNNDRQAGSTQLKVLAGKGFAFYYPNAGQLKIDLLPCPADGYINNFKANLTYDLINEKILYSNLETKRISVGLASNPLLNAATGGMYNAFFDSKGISINEQGIKNIEFEKERNDCFPQGRLNNFLTIDIRQAHLVINPLDHRPIDELPVKTDELKKFHGFDISDALVTLDYSESKKPVSIRGNVSRLLAGANFVAAKINIPGEHIDGTTFQPAGSKATIDIRKLEQFLSEKGCFRVQTKVTGTNLEIQFYTEK